jgi:hypothetical protein
MECVAALWDWVARDNEVIKKAVFGGVVTSNIATT